MRDLAERRGIDLEVYGPAEDSYLLVTAVIERIAPDDVVLDVGTGSGFVAERLANTVGVRAVGVDVNPHACRAARDRGVSVVRGDLVGSIRNDSCDVVVCNPPYLPETDTGRTSSWFERAVEAPAGGRGVLERLLETVPRVLRDGGRCFAVVSSHMDVGAVKRFAVDRGYCVERVVTDDSYPDETLAVLRFTRTDE